MELADLNLVQITKYLAAALAILPLTAVARALGNIFLNAINSVGRNPSARDAIFPLTVLGFALTEAIALFALLIAFLILFT